MKTYIFIQNIIAPYRVSFFNDLFTKGFNFKVFYMRESEMGRSWRIDLKKLNYPHFIDTKGFYFFLKKIGFHFHFNPFLIYRLLKEKESELILGGSWNDINVITLCVLKRLGITKKRFHIWSEANMNTLGARKDSLIKRTIRNFVFNTIDGNFIVPGKMAELTFEKWNIKPKKFVHLPNLIDENVFQLENNYLEKRKQNPLPVFFIPIRLIESIKGALNFFNAIGIENIKRSIFLIAGDGDDEDLYKEYIKNNELQENIFLLGFQNYQQINNLYNKANIFLLPSFSDPSPLSIVEALKMKLPLLVSTYCGNHYEALKEGINGYGFNPHNSNEIKEKYEKLMSEKEMFDEYGLNSFQIYLNNFDKNTRIENFTRQMREDKL
ncbi:glycosyltransferase family 4 protein [Capnocytophaga sp. Marseille-Q4570]|uniref:Glycosyltransferase family 4 protein n=2 Tax=Capnocytophaga bilenii TaxID=2819369 RepID=A0ABS3PX99_9FLAO|nr:glycosyltransferase family 4 protein [Capnocytophaga bilenii]